LWVQLHVEYADGTSETVLSDETWKVAKGPIVRTVIQSGETYDARLEKRGCFDARYDDSGWVKVQVCKRPCGKLSSQMIPPIKVMETIKPVKLTESSPGVYVYDMGKQQAGWARLKVSGPAGTKVVLRYAERLNEDGSIRQKANGKKVWGYQTDTYILKGQGVEIWEPRFVYHGFRYVEVTGFPGKATLDNLEGRFVHTAFERSSEFTCSNDLLNKIYRNTLRSYASNYHGIPTDNPAREKSGWTGDGQIAAEQAMFSDWNGPGWDSAYVIIPWYLYQYYGDVRILETHYEGMKRFIDYQAQTAKDHIITLGNGDWAPVNEKTPKEVMSTAYYYSDTKTFAQIARLLGKVEDAKKYSALAAEIRKIFNKRYFDTDSGLYSTGTQACLSAALFHGLVDDDDRDRVLKNLVAAVKKADWHLDTGILGSKYLPLVLSEGKRADVAYRVVSQTTFPGWGYWISQGATTHWEHWGGDKGTRNQIMFGDIDTWFFKGLAGINTDLEKVGFKHIIIRPSIIRDLRYVKAVYKSIHGRIVSYWQLNNDKFRLKVRIPANTTAAVYMPGKDLNKVTESGRPIHDVNDAKFLKTVDENSVFIIGSGEYAFESDQSGEDY